MFVAQLLVLFSLAHADSPIPLIDQQFHVDKAMTEIMQTSVGRSICRDILGANAEAIQFHLGVSPNTATQIAQNCSDTPVASNSWIVPTPVTEIRKSVSRQYEIVSTLPGFPIESWTDSAGSIQPDNKTVFLIRPPVRGEPMDKYLEFFKSRLTELLAHETAVYFDSKSNAAHEDAKQLEAFRTLSFGDKTYKIDPLTVVSNPLIAHTLTYIRALQVERTIMKELIAKNAVQAPSDFDDPYIEYLVSDKCQEKCIADRVMDMRQVYYPMALPMLAFSPTYRAKMQNALVGLQANLTWLQWDRLNKVMGSVSTDFLDNSASGERLKDLKTYFFDSPQSHPEIDTVTRAMRDDLLPLEEPSLFGVKVETPSGQSTLLEFMKRPLLSGHNLFLSSGPRVRIRTGNIEFIIL